MILYSHKPTQITMVQRRYNKLHSIFTTHEKKALKLLALKVAAHLNWNLNVLLKK
jgi:hypothetical protein